MKGIMIIILSMNVAVCFGQLRHDANWCFGDSSGIRFNIDGTLDAFNSRIVSFETAASVSTAGGDLLFAAEIGFASASDFGRLRTAPGIIIDGGDSLLMGNSISQGALFLPGSDSTTYYFYHLGYNPALSAQGQYSLELYRTTLRQTGPGHWAVMAKNELMVQGPLQEKVTAVHAFEKDCWWVLTHRETFPNCSNEFRLLKVCGGYVEEDVSQRVGQIKCVGSGYYGEMEFSPSGQLLAMALGTDSFELFSFNRCTGTLTGLASVGSGYGGGSYGIAFSPSGDMLYIAEHRNISDTSYVYQYNLLTSSITLLYKSFDLADLPGHLGLGPDGRVYLTYCGIHCGMAFPDSFQHCLGVVNFPNVAGSACGFVLFGYCFPDSTQFVAGGLPNFPNYNLGPEGVFLANAGKDTTRCSNTNSTGVPIGSPPVLNVTYLWQPATGLSATNIAQPTANPAQSMWYYLTATDTTATSCAVNTDSVYVKVETCTGITETPTLQAKLYPNPTTGALTVELANVHGGHFKLFNLLGQQVFEQSLEHDKTTFNLDLPKGIYLHQITAQGKVVNGKLVLGE